MTRTVRIALIALAQFALLASMIASHALVLQNGREVLLRTEPVDPRDLFRGDYVILRYEGLSSLPYTLVEGRAPLEKGDYVFVSLVEEGETWQAAAIYPDPPAIEAPVMRGRITYIHAAPRRQGANEEVEFLGPRTLHIDYGIESFFVPEGEGRDLEDARDAQTLHVLVAVSDAGRAAIKGLYLDGERIYEEGLF